MAEYKPQITLGNLIQMVIVLVSVVIGYANLDARSTRNRERLGDLQQLTQGQDIRIRNLEVKGERLEARTEERLASIITLLGKIDARLDRFEQEAKP